MLKVGILGGGQLGRMLLQAAGNYVVETHVMENDDNCPARHLCHHFTKGDIRNFDEVYRFGKGLDAITIEIESVNVDALEKLESEGVRVYPRPAAIRTIKNKITQKEFYRRQEIPTSPFTITANRAALAASMPEYPLVHKVGEGGYDGKGVQILRSAADLEKAFDAPSVLEKMVNVKMEIAVIVAVSDSGETALYPPTEMIFDPVLNLLDYQLCPANIPQKVLWKVEAITLKLARDLQSPGLFAIELFVDKDDEVMVNETAPRVHNSGHHTIEAHYSSQYDMLWRIILGYPLGNTAPILPSAIVNILGAEGHSGKAVYEGLNDVLKIDNAFVHLYGKAETKPGRKMGHVTILSKDRTDLMHKANKIKHTLKVVTA